MQSWTSVRIDMPCTWALSRISFSFYMCFCQNEGENTCGVQRKACPRRCMPERRSREVIGGPWGNAARMCNGLENSRCVVLIINWSLQFCSFREGGILPSVLMQQLSNLYWFSECHGCSIRWLYYSHATLNFRTTKMPWPKTKNSRRSVYSHDILNFSTIKSVMAAVIQGHFQPMSVRWVCGAFCENAPEMGTD